MHLCETCGARLEREGAVCPDCSTRQIAAIDDVPEIPGYRILRRLGEGGMGQVYLAEDVSLGRRVAVKLISGKIAADAAMTSRFLREARLLATIEHPHVVRVYSFGRAGDRPYLVMEYVEGQSLAELIRGQGRLPVEQALGILRETVEGLEAAHELKIIHRDIKPANILLDRRGHVRVADFGLAKQSVAGLGDGESSITQSGYVLGSPHYLSPEQAQGYGTDFRSDLYSLGVVLYEMLVGERPFGGSTPIAIVARHLHDPLPALESKRPEVPPSVGRLVESLTAKDPDGRPNSYREVIAAIERASAPGRDQADTFIQRTQETAAPAGPRAPWYGYAAGGVVLALLALVWWIQTRPLLRPSPVAAARPSDARLAIAVAPFYGPDIDSEKEGRVMAALVERSIASRLGRSEVRVVGLDETKVPVRSHEEARALATRLGAHVVVWGEAFALRGETEIQPYITAVGLDEPEAATAVQAATPDMRSARAFERLTESGTDTVKLRAEAPDQIEMRKTSAEGVGHMAAFLAGIHALHRQKDPARALRLFQDAPPSIDLLRQRAQAHIALEESDRAIEILSEVIAAEGDALDARAQLADLQALNGRWAEALPHYRALATANSPVTTQYGVFHEDRLIIREAVRSKSLTEGKLRDTVYVLIIDPQTMTVEKRLPLPAPLQRFTRRAGALFVEYKTLRHGNVGTLEFRDGAFTRPVSRGGNLRLRMDALRAGWVIPANFLPSIHGVPKDSDAPVATFTASRELEDDAPASLAELEPALRAAAERDPTQPWHLFFLGQTLQAAGRSAEAEATWRRMYASPYEGIAYFDWAWMARFHRRLGQLGWMREAIRRAERGRLADPHPIAYTTLIERLINLPYGRIHPAQPLDDATRHELLRSVRRMSGITEGDHLAAAAWRTHFVRSGDVEAAGAERSWYRRAIHEPMNMSTLATRLDYSVYALFATVFAFWSIVTLALDRRKRSAGERRAWGPAVLARWRRALAGPHRLLAIIGAVLAAAAALIGGVVAHLNGILLAPLAVLALIAASAFVRVTPISLRDRRLALAEVTMPERVVALLLFALVVVSTVVALRASDRLAAAEQMPMGIADSFGHIDFLRELEKKRAERDTPERRYAIAVSHHLAGDFDSARPLYASLSSDPRAARALTALAAGERRVELPGGDEMLLVLRGPGSFSVLRNIKEADRPAKTMLSLIVTVLVVTFVVALGLAIGFALVPPTAAANAPVDPPRFWRELLFPGAHAFRRRSPVLAALLSLSLWAILPPAIFAWRAVPILGSPGLITAAITPNLFSAFAMPSTGYRIVSINQGAWEWDRWTIAMAHPYAGVFWSLVGLMALFLIVFHTRAVIAVLRERRASKDSTIAQPQPASA